MTPTTPRRAHYDIVVVGARVAGAATAMLLARAGAHVLVVDRHARGADTLSTHVLMRAGVWQLHRWGVLDRIVDTGTPAITQANFFYGDREIRLPIPPDASGPGLYAPRRTLLDPVLAAAAEEAGAEVLHGVRVLDVYVDHRGRARGVSALAGGRRASIGADLVVGADGIASKVARAVAAPTYVEGRHAAAAIYTYVRDLPEPAYDTYFSNGVGAGVIPTDDGLACVFATMPADRFARTARGSVAATWRAVLEETHPDLAAAAASSTVVGTFRSFPGRPGHFRAPTGPGWALVGDAGHHNDSITAHGMTSALRDAELLAASVLGDESTYRCRRDELARPIFELTDRLASFEWTLDELQGLHIALSQAFKRETQTVASWPREAIAPSHELVPCA